MRTRLMVIAAASALAGCMTTQIPTKPMTAFLGAPAPQCAVGGIVVQDLREKNRYGLFGSPLAVEPDLGVTAAVDAQIAAEQYLVLDPRLPSRMRIEIRKSLSYEKATVGLPGGTVYGHELQLVLKIDAGPEGTFDGSYKRSVTTLQAQQAHYDAIRFLIETNRTELAQILPGLIANACKAQSAPPPRAA